MLFNAARKLLLALGFWIMREDSTVASKIEIRRGHDGSQSLSFQRRAFPQMRTNPFLTASGGLTDEKAIFRESLYVGSDSKEATGKAVSFASASDVQRCSIGTTERTCSGIGNRKRKRVLDRSIWTDADDASRSITCVP